MNFKRSFLVLSTIVAVFLLGGISQASAKGSILSDEQDKWLLQNIHSISFATEKDSPPLIWNQYGEYFGVSIDYFDFIQQLIDVRFTIHEPRLLGDILTAVKSLGEKSIISSTTMTPERSEYLLFTRPYFSSPAIYISHNSRFLTGSEIEQRNLTVAVGNLFGAHEYLENRYEKMRLIPLDNDYQVIQAVRNGQADIGVTDVASLMYLINENNISDIYKIGDTGFVYNYSFAVPKSMPELRNILDDAIEAIPQSFQQSVLEKWDVDSSGIKRLMGDQFIQSSEDIPDKKYITILVVAVGLLVIFIDFLIQKYLLKKRDEEHMHNLDSHIIEDLNVSKKK